MKNQVEKTEPAKKKQFSVIVEKQEVINTTDIKEAKEKIKSLQQLSVPLFFLIDNKSQKSTRYSKTIHEKNYRIQAGNFEQDSITKQTPEEQTAQE